MRALQTISRMLRRGRCRKGAAAAEFALVAAPLVLLGLGTLEFSGVMIAQVVLEGGVKEASRFGLTGYQPDGRSREQVIRDIVSEHAGALLSSSNITITTLVYQNFQSIGEPEPFSDLNGNGTYDVGEPFTDVNGNGQWDPDMGRAGAGGAGDVVLYTVNYNWPMMTGWITSIIGLSTIPLRASIAVRNEPF